MMNRKKLYEKTVNILLDAYNSGKLMHGDCTACAVGNICGNNRLWSYLFVTTSTKQYKEKPGFIRLRDPKGEVIEIKNEELPKYVNSGFSFGNVFYVTDNDYYTVVPASLSYIEKKQKGLELIESTGYTLDELARIEFAFENSIRNTQEGYEHYTDEDPKKGQFIGLTAVLNVLAEIHATPEKSTKANQEKLEKVYAHISI